MYGWLNAPLWSKKFFVVSGDNFENTFNLMTFNTFIFNVLHLDYCLQNMVYTFNILYKSNFFISRVLESIKIVYPSHIIPFYIKSIFTYSIVSTLD
jgi:hypothetical protein